MERNVQALSAGKSIDTSAPVVASVQSASNGSSVVNAMPKDLGEFALIKKDILFSIVLVLAVIASFLIIYLVDRNSHFLLPLANKIFTLLQK